MSEEKIENSEENEEVAPEATGTCFSGRHCGGQVVMTGVTKKYCFDNLSGKGWKNANGKCYDYLD